MSSGAPALAGWGLALLALALLGAAGFDLDVLPALLLAGAGAAAVATGALQALAARRGPAGAPGGEPVLLLRSSAATLVLTAGAALAFVGAVVMGPALLWPGIGFVGVGGAGIVRELRAARQMRAAARGRRTP